MVKPNHAGRGNQVMLFVLKFGKALRQVADAPVENIRQVRNAMLALGPFLPPLLDRIPQEIPHGFRAALVRPIAEQCVKRGGEFVIDCNGYSLHGLN